MKTSSLAVLAVLVLSGLSGCATTVPSAFFSHRMLASATEPTGAIFGSIGMNPFDAYGTVAQRLYVRRVGEKTGKDVGSISFGKHGNRLVPDEIVERRTIGDRPRFRSQNSPISRG